MASIRTCSLLFCAVAAQASDFADEFSGDELPLDPSGRAGWATMTGDGEATMRFTQGDGVGLIEVDARADRRNTWWAVIRRSVSQQINGDALADPGMELRVEARIRVSHAPRRVNLHFNHSRTTDFHSHLMEYDIPDTDNWHVISFTTSGFDARPADEVFVQMALMDWGRDVYRVEVDYLVVSVVDPDVAGPDLGEPLRYRPDVPPLPSFGSTFVAVDDTPDSQWRWDFAHHAGCRPTGWGALAIETSGDEREMRIVEVLGDGSLNGQMVVDVPAGATNEGIRLAPISPPVLRRLLDGRTKGLAAYSLGEEAAVSFSERPVLYMNIEQPCAAAGS